VVQDRRVDKPRVPLNWDNIEGLLGSFDVRQATPLLLTKLPLGLKRAPKYSTHIPTMANIARFVLTLMAGGALLGAASASISATQGPSLVLAGKPDADLPGQQPPPPCHPGAMLSGKDPWSPAAFGMFLPWTLPWINVSPS
jgi:hypothetical protein